MVERGVAGGFPSECGSPVFEVGKIDVGGEIDAAGGLGDLAAFEALVARVAAEGSAGTAVVEIGKKIAVIDREHAA